ncbi:transposase [Streptomyces sp. MK7]|uniref:transposase n=1 Tax=Streptomyces sp. MK7 TaxID=3067635 RepID=UPI00292D0067|nr:transposase [Streptomyces sp. MK7]
MLRRTPPSPAWKDVAVPKPYPKEFREDVVRGARNREPGVTLEQIAADFGVHPITLSKWLRRADTDEGARPAAAGRVRKGASSKTRPAGNRERRARPRHRPADLSRVERVRGQCGLTEAGQSVHTGWREDAPSPLRRLRPARRGRAGRRKPQPRAGCGGTTLCCPKDCNLHRSCAPLVPGYAANGHEMILRDAWAPVRHEH